MSTIVECSPPGGFPDAVTGLRNLRPGTNRMLVLDCGHDAIVERDYPIGAGYPCSWFGCPGNPETRCNCGIIGDYPYEHAATCPKYPGDAQ